MKLLSLSLFSQTCARAFVAAVWFVNANHVLLLCFLQVLGQVVNMRLQVFMNCRAKLSELPLKR